MGVSPRMEISPCELQLGLSSEMHPTCQVLFRRPDVPDGTYILSLDAHDYSFDQVCKGFFDIQVTLVLTFTVAVQSGC